MYRKTAVTVFLFSHRRPCWTFYFESSYQTQPSPEPPDKLVPRLCHMVRGEHGYGFNLHNDKAKRGQFVRAVDPGSAADSADLRPGDRLVEVQLNTRARTRTHTESIYCVHLYRKGLLQTRVTTVINLTRNVDFAGTYLQFVWVLGVTGHSPCCPSRWIRSDWWTNYQSSHQSHTCSLRVKRKCSKAEGTYANNCLLKLQLPRCLCDFCTLSVLSSVSLGDVWWSCASFLHLRWTAWTWRGRGTRRWWRSLKQEGRKCAF